VRIQTRRKAVAKDYRAIQTRLIKITGELQKKMDKGKKPAGTLMRYMMAVKEILRYTHQIFMDCKQGIDIYDAVREKAGIWVGTAKKKEPERLTLIPEGGEG